MGTHMLITVNDLKKNRTVCKLCDDSGLKREISVRVCMYVCVCVGREEFEILKKKLQWNEERVNNKLKQNWSINHDWSEEK